MSSDPRSVIRKVLITEKGTVMRETLRQYFFEVARDANKIEIKRAVEAVFHVKVDSVQTMQMKGKTQVRGRIIGKRNDWKKAIVTLKPDHKIELFEQI
jgi:large subunit ribosomal protein L23